MERIRSVAFVVNVSKPGALELAEDLVQIATTAGTRTEILTAFPLESSALMGYDLCCVIGGDGTLLGVLDAVLSSGSIVLGVNMGKLGFLATLTPSEAAANLAALIQGHYGVKERSVLSCQVGDGEPVYALNDIVIKETQGNSLARLKVLANEEAVSEYHCDGLIFATPTGSTAYNLSAGGPIISPAVQAMVMTPICPHTLGNRSVIFDNATQIRVQDLQSASALSLVMDGRVHIRKPGSSPLKIKVAEKAFCLMHSPHHSHFAIVRDKLHWGSPTIRTAMDSV